MPAFDGDCLEDRPSAALVHPLPGGFPLPTRPCRTVCALVRDA